MIIQLPDYLNASAYKSQTGESAWPRTEAIAVINLATQSNIAVFGVEVWLPTTPGPTIPTPIIYVHDVQGRADEESWKDFVARANSDAREYISKFQWDDTDHAHKAEIPFFNLTFGDE